MRLYANQNETRVLLDALVSHAQQRPVDEWICDILYDRIIKSEREQEKAKERKTK